MERFATTKSTIECYKIRSTDGGFAWADITIDANGTTGRIQIASDYGNWQNYWSHCGTDFKSFLGRINSQYAAEKFSAQPWIDVAGTVQLYKETLFSYRRAESITAEDARDLYRSINDLKHECHTTIGPAVEHDDKLLRFLFRFLGSPEFCHEPNGHFVRFWKELWPVLLAEFERERQAEPATVAA
jgi:hypothetical protein